MNRLPNMMVLDFCEYLRRRPRGGITVFDLVYDDSNHNLLERYAEEYLSGGRKLPIKSLLHRFIDSKYFDECLRRHPFNRHTNGRAKFNIKELRYFLEDCCCGRYCEGNFRNFLEEECDGDFDNFDVPKHNVSPYELADNVRAALQYDSEPVMMKFMTTLDMSVAAEIDFLEWLLVSYEEPLKISEMPVSVFETIVDEYVSEYKKNERTRKQLIKSFKQTDSHLFTTILERFFPNSSEKKTRTLQQVIDRYYDGDIPYKCVFLPLKADSAEYKKLINDYWHDLHHLSGDSLDIFYSDVDYGKSGYEIQRNINSLPRTLSPVLPCIVLWGDDINTATTINIERLTNSEIFSVVVSIVEAIKQKKSFADIIVVANTKAQEIRDKNRPVAVIHGDNITVGGDYYKDNATNNSFGRENIFNAPASNDK
jgi:hypothetical protein